MRFLLIVFSIASFIPCFANNIVDIYGTDNIKKSQIILKHYSKEIGNIEEALLRELKKNSNESSSLKFEEIIAKKNKLQEKIKKEFNFLNVDFQTINYFDDKNIYTTIEVIEANQPRRLQFLEKPSSRFLVKKHNDLIDKMIQFNNLEMKLILNKQISIKNIHCPVYHCVAGFQHPLLKPYLSLFNKGAIKEKKLIIATLNHDPDLERRAAAVFLTAHFKEPKDIIALLSLHLNDPSPKVRNNVMRVIGQTMEQGHLNQFSISPFLAMLDSTHVTDRNKALIILLNAAEAKESKVNLIKNGQHALIALLRLKQPNNHKLAYQILQKISGQDLGEYDCNAWNKWFAQAKKLIH